MCLLKGKEVVTYSVGNKRNTRENNTSFRNRSAHQRIPEEKMRQHYCWAADGSYPCARCPARNEEQDIHIPPVATLDINWEAHRQIAGCNMSARTSCVIETNSFAQMWVYTSEQVGLG